MEVILKHRLIQRELACSLGFLGSSPGKGSACNAGDLSLIPGSGSSPGEAIGLPTPVFLGFPGSSAGEESTCNAGDLGSIRGLGTSPGEGNSYLPIPVFWAGEFHGLSHAVTKSQTRLNDFHFHFVGP